MSFREFRKLLVNWNTYELESLKVYIEVRNRLKDLTSEEISDNKLYRENLSIDYKGNDIQHIADEFDIKKLEHLRLIFEYIHLFDSKGAHDISLWCIYKTIKTCVEDMFADTDLEEVDNQLESEMPCKRGRKEEDDKL